MLTLTNTPNLAGIAIAGDAKDLESLYYALHEIVGEDGEFLPFDSARTRVLGVCYDLRHAFQGDRDLEYVESGMDRDKMRWMGRIAPEQNLYYQVAVLYPELLFVTMALDDFVRLYAKKRARSAPFPLLDRRVTWDINVAQVRLLQSKVDACVKEAVSEASYKRIINLMHHDYLWLDGYVDQYLDLLNIRYLELETALARKQALLTTVKRMVEKGSEYRRLADQLEQFARESGAFLDNITLAENYPEHIDW